MIAIIERALGLKHRAKYIDPNLRNFERKEFSQFGEDGIVERLAQCLQIERGTFFEFGIGPAWNTPPDSELEGNFVLLRKRGWAGVFLDGNDRPHHRHVSKEFITPLNINELYRKYNLPNDLDFMSIDVDGQELWIWLALVHQPKVVVVEYNGGIPIDKSISIQFDVGHVWDHTRYHGASLMALHKVGCSKGYTLVFANGVNAFFVRDDLISNAKDFRYEDIYTPFQPHAEDELNRPWVVI